jgi:hypothetical protein
MLPAHESAPWWHREFARAVDGSCPLDLTEAAILLSAHRSLHLRSVEDIPTIRQELVALSTECPGSFDAWQRRMFVDYGFSGNGIDYHDVRNSFLPDVIQRRIGIPISLAVVGLDLANRIGLQMWGISFPGHFLLGTPYVEHRFVDPFNGGTTLTVADCVALHDRMFGANHPFDESQLVPSPNETILIRMLMNLKSNYARMRDLDGLTSVMRLRSALPDFSFHESIELIRLLDATGAWHESLKTIHLLRLHFPMHEDQLDDEENRLITRLN